MLPIECIVRGYITGSGWASYKENGTRLDALVDIDYLEKIKRYIVSM